MKEKKKEERSERTNEKKKRAENKYVSVARLARPSQGSTTISSYFFAISAQLNSFTFTFTFIKIDSPLPSGL